MYVFKKNDYAFCHVRTQRCFLWDLRVICLKPRRMPALYLPLSESKSPLGQILPLGHKTASCHGPVRGLLLLWWNQLANADGHPSYQEPGTWGKRDWALPISRMGIMGGTWRATERTWTFPHLCFSLCSGSMLIQQCNCSFFSSESKRILFPIVFSV